MDEEESALRALITEYLAAHTQCSACGNGYRPEDVRIQSHRGHVWLAAATCSRCGLQALIMAAIKVRNVESEAEESVPGLDVGELGRFQQMEPITGDEVLDFHAFMASFRGDVHQLLTRGDHP